MTLDVAVFLDLDNLAIGAKQAGLLLDIDLILEHVQKMTNGRIVYRQAYGDSRLDAVLHKKVGAAGFITQFNIPTNGTVKNLTDMQIVVDAMATLADGRHYNTYVLITGDRDFTPLVHALRKRGKQVIGIGVQHTVSRHLISLCDQYVFYRNILSERELSKEEVKALLVKAIGEVLQNQPRASVESLYQRLLDLSYHAFANTIPNGDKFTKWLQAQTDLVELFEENKIWYMRRPTIKIRRDKTLHQRYRSALKKQKFRIVEPHERQIVLRDLVMALQEGTESEWRSLGHQLAAKYQQNGAQEISKNVVNAVMLIARQAGVIGTAKSHNLATAPVVLQTKSDKPVREAIARCDKAYLEAIMALPEPFDIVEASLAIYGSVDYVEYLKLLSPNIPSNTV